MAVKKARRGSGGDGQDRAPATQRCCGKCGETRHNAQTCQKDREPSSESKASTQYIFSDSSSSDDEDRVTWVGRAKKLSDTWWCRTLGNGIR